MKMQEIRELSKDELIHKLEDLNEETFNLRFQKAKNLLENHHKLSGIRKDIARIKTLMTEKNIRG
ncbi:MAG: 50S ribosomal protein L29 [Candidatus Cloacimonadota bacterium]|nr:50S ribosomal protein L29 [Candidatus Cloacimonadota bacterium]